MTSQPDMPGLDPKALEAARFVVELPISSAMAASEDELASSPRGEARSPTTSEQVHATAGDDRKGGAALAAPPDPESVAGYFASIWKLSNHQMGQLTSAFRKFGEQHALASSERSGREAVDVLAEPNTNMAIRLADRLIAEGFQEPDEDTAVLSLAVIQLSDVIRNLAGTKTNG